jgi:S-DNA-T family DNA segregation ATPase FtsK/SpoIIIE
MRKDARGKVAKGTRPIGTDTGETSGIGRKTVLIILLAGWAFVGASLIGFDRADPPSHLAWPQNNPAVNWCGTVGAFLSYHLLKTLGYGAYVLVAFAGLGLLSAAGGQRVRHPLVRAVGLVMLTIACSGAQALVFPKVGPFPDLPGGTVGYVGTAELVERFGVIGTMLWIAVLAFLGAVVAMDEWINWALGWTWRWTREKAVPAAVVAGKATGGVVLSAAGAAAGAAASGAGRVAGGVSEKGGLRAALAGLFSRGTSEEAVKPRSNDIDDDKPDAASEFSRPSLFKGKAKKGSAVAEEESEDLDETVVNSEDEADENDGEERVVVDEDEDDELYGEVDEDDAEEEEPAKGRKKPGKSPVVAKPGKDVPIVAADEEEDGVPGAPQVFDADALRNKISKLPIAFGQQNKQVATQADLDNLQNATPNEDNYRFPSLDVLENPEENFTLKLEHYVREQAVALEAALKQYKIDGEVESIESGPVITAYNVKLAPGTKVAALSAVASDVARSLKAVNIRIVANQAGRDTVAVEVPNSTKEKVRLKELMGNTERYSKMRLPLFLGKDAGGQPLIEDLTKMPHMLIAGTTGSGKSVCMNTIIMGFLYTKKPSELKLVLVDPKMVEMSQFKDIPHLMCPVVTEMGKAAAILEWACQKMDERYALLSEAGCRDIVSYNELPWEEMKERLGVTPEEEHKVPRKLPYMVFIIDELADLMMTAKEVESHIIRIAQKARAVGIHLILATQRPQANVVTGLIKGNMPARICFKVASGLDSRIVLDQKGGELLLGQGDMLYMSANSHKLSRCQGTLVDDKEIRTVVKFMRDVAGPSFERQLISLRKPNSDEDRVLASQNNSSASLAAAQEDPMFFRAVDICLETRRGSVSLLQRRLAIGYTRASRLIDLMGIAGIISDHKGSVARDVLLSADEWDAMKQLAAKEAASQGKSISFDAPAEEQQALFVEPGAAPSSAGEASAEDAVEEEAAVDEEEELEEDAVDEAEDAEESEEDSEESAEAEELPPFPPGVEVRTRDQRPASGEPRGKRS